MACSTSFDAEHYICTQEIYLCSHKLNSPIHFLAQTQTHPHISVRKQEEKWWQKATAEGAEENILNTPGEAVQVNCLAYAMYKWMAIYWEKERIIANIYASCMCIKKKIGS